jgi:flagellar M-ring protein FliF
MVAITDQYGHYLSSKINSSDRLNQEHLNYQHNLEQGYEKRIQALILPLLGENKASISVNADVDFTEQEESKEDYDPSQKVLRSEQRVKEDSNSASGGGVPGSLSNQPPTNKQAGGSDGQTRSDVVKNYEVSKSTTYVKAGAPKITRVSVALILDNDMVFDERRQKMVSKPIEKEKLAKITDLVKSSIGYKETRGDVVTVVNSVFVAPKVENYKEPGFWQEPWFWDLFKKLSGIILGFVFLFIIYRKIAPELSRKKTNNELGSKTSSDSQSMISADMIRMKNEQIGILKDLVASDPNKVVGVIKKWVAK